MNDRIIKRNLDLVAAVTDFILKHPHFLDQLPSDFRLVVLPEDDPELSLYNLNLLAEQAESDKPVIIVRMVMHQADFEHTPPQLYVPLVS